MAGVVQAGVLLVVVVAMVMTAVRSRICSICTRFRLERRFDFGDRATDSLDHLGQYVIGLEAQRAAVGCRQDLHRHVAVAEVVGRSGEKERRVGGGFDELLRRGEDFDDGGAVLGQQPVIAVQVVAAFEKDAGFLARCKSDFQAAALALVVGECDGVGGWVVCAVFRG